MSPISLIWYPSTSVSLYIYDSGDNLILTLKDLNQKAYKYDDDGNLKKYTTSFFMGYPLWKNLKIHKLKGNKYLLLVGKYLGIFEDDKFIILTTNCRNFRLRNMKDISKWKKAAKRYILQNNP